MPFPTTPIDGQLYYSAQGTLYKYYSSKNVWRKEGLSEGYTGLSGETGSYFRGDIINISWADFGIFSLDQYGRIHNGVTSSLGYVMPRAGRIKDLSYCEDELPSEGTGHRIAVIVNEAVVYASPDILSTSPNVQSFPVEIEFNAGDQISTQFLAPGDTGLVSFGGGSDVILNSNIELYNFHYGYTGTRGLTGYSGETGLIGPTGVIGYSGLTGFEGIQGATGSKGSTGIDGLQPNGQLFLLAQGGWPSTTNGCGDLVKTEYTTNKINTWHLPFDPDVNEYAQWKQIMPSDYDSGTLTAAFHWTADSGSGSVVWAIQCMCLGDDDAIDRSWGTARTTTDTLITADSVHISGNTAAITPSGTLGPSKLMLFRVYRDATSGTDTLTSDAKLIGVKINYTRI